MKSHRTLLFLWATLLVLTLSMMSAAPALADDGPPPPAQEEQAASEDALPADLPENTEVVVLAEDGSPLPLASEAAAQVMQQADPRWCPAGVTPGAASCSPSFVKFNGVGGLIEWLETNNPGVAGVIWVEANYDSGDAGEGGTIMLDGSTLTNMRNFALTINGGWSGAANTTLNPNDPSEFNHALQIQNWVGAVTINNIVITGAASGPALQVYTDGNITLNNVDVVNNASAGADLDNSGLSGTGNVVINDSAFNGNSGDGSGLQVYSNGTITGKNLSVNNNTGGGYPGAWLDNASSSTPKAITLTGFNTFNANDNGGLKVFSKGAVTLSNLNASYNNGGRGVYVDNCQYNITSEFCDTTSGAGVTLNGFGNFTFNGGDGLRVVSGGIITTNNLTAIGNGQNPDPYIGELEDDTDAGGKGVLLYNWGSLTPKAVNINGANQFEGNASSGLFVYSWGAVKANNLTANFNGDGGWCNNTDELDFFCDGVNIYDADSFMLTGYGSFRGNYDDGLSVDAYKVVTLTNLTAIENGWRGVHVINQFDGAAINITGTNIFEGNSNQGLSVYGVGVITIANITATNNDSDGAYLFNNSIKPNSISLATPNGVALGYGINVNGLANLFNGNGGSGLVIQSSGAVNTNNLTASGNGSNGLYVDNCLYTDNNTTGGGNGVDDYCLNAGKAVNLKGVNAFHENGLTGMWIESAGPVTVSKASATYNTEYGIRIDNCLYEGDRGTCMAPAGKTVTFSGYITASDNVLTGLYVSSFGNIVVANLTADYNGEEGAYLDNDFNTAAGAVTLSGFASASNNWAGGIYIYSRGAVKLANVTANYNGYDDNGNRDGLRIFNAGHDSLKVTTPGVTLTGFNTFLGNWNHGLYIESYGAITLNNITANYNGAPYDISDNPTPYGSGADIWNSDGDLMRPVTLNGINTFNGNWDRGLQIHSLGAITLSKVTANDNGEYGAYVTNWYEGKSKMGVTITGYGIFNGNGWDTTGNGDGYGLLINSHGNVTLSNISANYNDDGGAYIEMARDDTLSPTTPVNFTLLGVNTFLGNAGETSLGNDGSGLTVYTDGMITLNNVNASNNSGSYGTGVYLDQGRHGSSFYKNVVLKGFNLFNNNTLDGLYINATGDVSVERFSAVWNGGMGVHAYTNDSISLTCGSLLLNSGMGYDLSNGAAPKTITLKGVYLYGNGATEYASMTPIVSRTCPLP